MTSTLNDQLKKLASATGIIDKKSRGKPSLLHTFQDAADIGLEDIYELAYQGFEKLRRLDVRFQPFSKSLFGRSTLTLDRDQQTAEVNAKLDAAIGTYCKLLSAYFMMPAAFQTLEYLIRRFRVHEINVNDLMKCALPYHATPQFVRLVHVLHLERTSFEFLTPMQKSGAALPRESLVQRCITDRSLLRFVCDMAQELANPKVACRSAMPFYAALICEIIGLVPELQEDTVAMLLPYLLAGLGSDVIADYRSATYMALTQLASRATMTADLVGAITTSLCKTLSPAGLPEGVMILAHLAYTQPHMTDLPDKAFKHLAKLPGLADEIAALAQRKARVQPLVDILTAVTVQHFTVHANYIALLKELITKVPLGPASRSIATSLMAIGQDEEHFASVCEAMVPLGVKYPLHVDAAANEVMSKLPAPSGKDKGKESAAGTQRAVTLKLLQAAYGGTPRAPLSETNTTVATALEWNSAAIRKLALLQLQEIPLHGEEAGAIQGIVLRRLVDEDPSVVSAALGVANLAQLPPTAVIDALDACINTSMHRVNDSSTPKHVKDDLRGVARKALQVLGGAVAEKHPEHQERVIQIVLGQVLATPKTLKVASKAVNVCKGLDHPLLQGLKEVDTKVDAAPRKEVTPSKKGKKTPAKSKHPVEPEPLSKGELAATLNTAVISALAQAAGRVAKGAVESPDASEVVARKALERVALEGRGQARAVALAACNAALSMEGGKHIAVDLLTHFVQSKPAPAIKGSPVHDINDGNEAFDSVTDQGLPSEALLKAIAKGEVDQHALYASVILSAIRAMSSTTVQSLKAKGLERLFTRLCHFGGAVWHPHLEALTLKATEVVPASLFLSQIFGGAPEGDSSSSTDAQVAALQLLASLVQGDAKLGGSSSKGKKSEGASVVTGHPDLILHLLCALGHPQQSVRTAALGLAQALSTAGAAVLSEVALPQAVAHSMVQALLQHEDGITQDSEAVEWLLLHALEPNGGLSQGVSSPGTARRSRGATTTKKKKDTAAMAAAAARESALLSLSSTDAEAIKTMLLERLPEQKGKIGFHVAHYLLSLLSCCTSPGTILFAGHALLKTFAVQVPLSGTSAAPVAALPADKDLTDAHHHLAAELVSLGSDAAVMEVGAGDEIEGFAASVLSLMKLPAPPRSEATRSAAAGIITPRMYALLADETQRAMFLALLEASSGDADDRSRAAAHAALATLPVSGHTLVPLLSPSAPLTPVGTPKQRRRKTSGAASEGQGPTTLPASYLPTLEVLLWKEGVIEPLILVPALQAALAVLLEAAIIEEEAEAPVAAAAGKEGEAEGTDVLTARGYAMQLTLTMLRSLALGHLKVPASSVAQTPSRGSKKKQPTTAAAAPTADQPFDLALVLKCAQQAPDGSVRNAALSLVGALAGIMPAATLGVALQAVAVVGESAAMLKDAYSSEVATQMLGAIVPAWVASGESLDVLLDAVLDALPSLPETRKLAVMTAVMRCMENHGGPAMCLLVLLKRVKTSKGDWARDLMGALSQQVPAAPRLEALAALVSTTLDQAGDPTAALPLIAAAFTTEQLTKLPLSSNKGAESEKEGLLAGCKAVMQAGLQLLQQLGAAADNKPAAVVKTATTTVYALLEALQRVMEPAAFITGLVSLTASPGDRIRRRALNLLASKLRQDLADGEGNDVSSKVTAALLAAVDPAVKLLGGQGGSAGGEPVSNYTRQAAIALLGLLCQVVSKSQPQRFVAAVPAVLALTSADQLPPVRASALACVSAIASSLGTQLVPILPITAQAVVKAAQSAVQSVADSVPEAGGSDDGEQVATSEAAALELAAALAAMSALVDSLGAFLAPQLPVLLGVVLHPVVLKCHAARCASTAASIRQKLTQVVPPRLLLTPVVGALDDAAAHGAASVQELLHVLGNALKEMDAAGVASYHEAIFSFLLRALDLRRAPPPALAADREGVDAVEAAAVRALVELTLLLSETRFRPLFLRLAEWADTTPPATDGQTGPALGRKIALFSVANALGENLRSVFVPYFKALIDPAVEVLSAGAATEAAPAKKKQRKGKAAAAEQGAAHHAAEDQWQLKLKTIRALHRCFLYDSVGFLDEARFNRLLDPLTAQLHTSPPASVLPLLEADVAQEGGLDGLLAVEAQYLDVYGRAVAACLAQMAVTAGGGDAMWRPLNHAVLMASRSDDPRTRLLSLETVAALSSTLREEYLGLLPEALPFLGELLEDVEGAVERRATGVVKALEELSGEDLSQYMKGA